ncbi:MAG: DUF1249 domain-containing protein [SAR86 cluster bacterium]|uniref:DUF1249 domain-containing protein n=1 Tax=SAR86 cluster bacterium TaxID=2030880 RepID=A0A520N6W1_9GAMM|nr:MAG: DUF1249 domain-containing protein [SAR86 cluster bacterium]|tara:strand:- start:2154 stop:2576 length:423 start_codon:yes stop_codon:yes gene_type:complete
MLKKLPKTSHQLSICEANFLRLKKILNGFNEDRYLFETINPNSSSNSISFNVLQRSRHTIMVEAKQNVNYGVYNSFILRIQICIDAKVAEVISYQGEKAIPFFVGITKSQSKDEKLQQNRFLTEWLESIFITGINPNINF